MSELTDNVQYSNADQAFAAAIINDIKRAQRLPLNVTPADVFNAISTQIDWWYESVPYATQDDQIAFDVALLSKMEQYVDSANFPIYTNAMVMPSAVWAIYQAFYIGTGFLNRTSWTFAKWQLESVLLSSTPGLNPNYGSDTYMASIFATNLLTSVGKEPVLYEFNRLTHLLQVFDNGDRVGHIFCKVARCLPISSFYSDVWFRRFIISHVLSAICDHIELFGAQLPGDLSINTGVLRTRADKLMDDVVQHMEAETENDVYIIKT